MKRNGERILQTLLVFLMMAGTVLAFYEQVGGGAGSPGLWLCLAGLAAVLVCYGARPGRKNGFGWLLFLLAILAAAWYFGAGWQAVAARIFALYEDYYQIRIPLKLPNLLPGTIQIEGALWTLGALSGVGAAYGLTGRRKQMLFLLQLPVLLLLFLLLGGVMPSVPAVVLWFLSAVGSLFYLRLLRGSSHSEVAEGLRFFYLFLGGTAALFLIAFAVKEPVYDSIKENRRLIEEKIGNFQEYRWDQIFKRLRGGGEGGSRKANMGIAGGQIGRVEELIPGNGTDLVLTWEDAPYTGAEKRKSEEIGLWGEIYIRAFASGSYKNGCWEAPSLKEEASAWQETFLMNPLPAVLEENLDTGTIVKDRIRVSVEDAEEDYLYVPGLAAPSKAADYRNRLYAVWAEGEESRELAWDVYRPRQSAGLEAFLQPDVRAGLLAAYYENTVMELSDGLARSDFLEVPEALRGPLEFMLTETAAKYGWDINDFYDREDELLMLVRQTLWDRAVYTYRPGAVPEGEDLILWFLTENEKGYCTHFASAGVMLFRILDIPARYCEGYKVVGDGRQQIEVKNRNAHAWVEVYLSGFGWVPVEVTPGYVGQAAQETAELEPETEPEEIPETEPEAERTPSGPEDGIRDGKRLAKWGLLSAAAAAFAVFFLRKRHRGRKHASRRRSGSRKREIERYVRNRKQIEKEYGGRIPWETLPETASFKRRSALDPQEEETLERLYEEAVFSDHKMRAESVSFAAGCYEKTLRFYGRHLTGPAGIWFRLRYRKQLRGGPRNV